MERQVIGRRTAPAALSSNQGNCDHQFPWLPENYRSCDFTAHMCTGIIHENYKLFVNPLFKTNWFCTYLLMDLNTVENYVMFNAMRNTDKGDCCAFCLWLHGESTTVLRACCWRRACSRQRNVADSARCAGRARPDGRAHSAPRSSQYCSPHPPQPQIQANLAERKVDLQVDPLLPPSPTQCLLC